MLKQGRKPKMKLAELQSKKIKTLAEGHDLIEAIENHMRTCLHKMQEGVSNEEHTRLTDLRYELKKVRFDIRNQMAKIVKENRK